MPGIAGFTRAPVGYEEEVTVLRKMRDLITHHDYYVQDPLFYDNNVCGTRAHINIIQKEQQPYQNDGVYVWLDGEFYNHSELQALAGMECENDLVLLSLLYQRKENFEFLSKIDGIYAAVIYDSGRQEVHLISDRYGLRQLFWSHHQGSLIWGSELKTMLALPGYTPVIDKMAVEQFIEIGYLLENRTWFENVELIPPGTILTYDLGTKTIVMKPYWWWNEIKPLTGRLDENEIIEQLGALFRNAVQLRSTRGNQIGLQLSGGLDSRAILAAIPQSNHPMYALSFGKNGCDDIRFAALAAERKGAVQLVKEIDDKNWLMPRLDGIWWTDGLKDLKHMHGIVATSEDMRSKISINLNGFLGDAVLGGSYMKDASLINHPVNKRLAAKYMGCSESLLENYHLYDNLPKSDYYFIQNRGRRLISGGTKLTLTSIEHRKPFFDNALFDFVYSLPDSLRFHNYIYRKMLLAQFPEYFTDIPWQNTGFPISWPDSMVKIASIPKKINRKLSKGMERLGIPIHDPNAYTDYSNWIRYGDAKRLFQQTLKDDKAIYTNYIPRKSVIDALEKHMKGEDHTDTLCRVFTLEIWLQQVYNGRFRENHMRSMKELVL